jgi:hypothetical protein
LKFRIKTRDDLISVFKLLADKLPADLDLEVKDHEDDASDEQKHYRWAIITNISKNYAVNGQYFSKDAWNEHFKQEFVGKEELPSGRVRGLSPKGKHGMSDFIAQLEVFAAEHEIEI